MFLTIQSIDTYNNVSILETNISLKPQTAFISKRLALEQFSKFSGDDVVHSQTSGINK